MLNDVAGVGSVRRSRTRSRTPIKRRDWGSTIKSQWTMLVADGNATGLGFAELSEKFRQVHEHEERLVSDLQKHQQEVDALALIKCELEALNRELLKKKYTTLEEQRMVGAGGRRRSGRC